MRDVQVDVQLVEPAYDDQAFYWITYRGTDASLVAAGVATPDLNDMDSPCSYGIGCARLRVVGHSITEQEESA